MFTMLLINISIKTVIVVKRNRNFTFNAFNKIFLHKLLNLRNEHKYQIIKQQRHKHTGGN